jgi:hypothetical protein
MATPVLPTFRHSEAGSLYSTARDASHLMGHLSEPVAAEPAVCLLALPAPLALPADALGNDPLRNARTHRPIARKKTRHPPMTDSSGSRRPTLGIAPERVAVSYGHRPWLQGLARRSWIATDAPMARMGAEKTLAAMQSNSDTKTFQIAENAFREKDRQGKYVDDDRRSGKKGLPIRAERCLYSPRSGGRAQPILLVLTQVEESDRSTAI